MYSSYFLGNSDYGSTDALYDLYVGEAFKIGLCSGDSQEPAGYLYPETLGASYVNYKAYTDWSTDAICGSCSTCTGGTTYAPSSLPTLVPTKPDPGASAGAHCAAVAGSVCAAVDRSDEPPDATADRAPDARTHGNAYARAHQPSDHRTNIATNSFAHCAAVAGSVGAAVARPVEPPDAIANRDPDDSPNGNALARAERRTDAHAVIGALRSAHAAAQFAPDAGADPRAHAGTYAFADTRTNPRSVAAANTPADAAADICSVPLGVYRFLNANERVHEGHLHRGSGKGGEANACQRPVHCFRHGPGVNRLC